MSRTVSRLVSLGLAALVAVGLGVTPAAAVDVGLVGSLDTVTVTSDGAIRVTGWALATGGGSVFVHVYDTGPTRTVGTDLGVGRVGRPDVEAIFGQARAGFDRTLPAEQGTHRVCAYAVADRIAGRTVALIGCRDVSTGRAPVGSIDVIPSRSIEGESIQVRGWAYDPDQPQTPLQIHAYVIPGVGLLDGRVLPLAPVSRPDVAATIPGVGPTQGFEASVSLAHYIDAGFQSGSTFYTGKHSVCLFAIGVGLGGNTLLGCQDVDVQPKVNASLDTVTAPSLGVIAVSGWSYLAGQPAVSTVNTLSVSSQFPPGYEGTPTEFLADGSRPDVDRAFPGVGPNHGYSASTSVAVAPGRYSACVTTRGSTEPIFYSDSLSRRLCREVTVPNASGVIDSVTIGQAGPGTATVRGWAIDPTHPAEQTTVEAGLSPADEPTHEFFDDPPQPTTIRRPDVNAAFGITGAHGFEIVIRVPEWFTGAGQICVQAGVYSAQRSCFASFATRPVTIG